MTAIDLPHRASLVTRRADVFAAFSDPRVSSLMSRALHRLPVRLS